jgi:hypothetical protein
MDPLVSLILSLKAEFEDDHVGLWTIVKQVRRAYPHGCPEEIRKTTLALIKLLLQVGSVEAGFPTEDGRGFVSWDIEPYGVVTRIGAEWKKLGKEPTIGEIAWFTTPSSRPNRSAFE